MDSHARVRAWCEDREQEAFIRSLLERRGISRRRIYFQIAPGSAAHPDSPKRGMGSGSDWIIKRYVDVRTQMRQTKHQAKLGFLLMIDGDNVGLAGRTKQLQAAAGDREPDEGLAILVPTWSIETWVRWLSGSDADENTSYKRQPSREAFRQTLPSAVAQWNSPRAGEQERVPSLSAARAELLRLP